MTDKTAKTFKRLTPAGDLFPVGSRWYVWSERPKSNDVLDYHALGTAPFAVHRWVTIRELGSSQHPYSADDLLRMNITEKVVAVEVENTTGLLLGESRGQWYLFSYDLCKSVLGHIGTEECIFCRQKIQ